MKKLVDVAAMNGIEMDRDTVRNMVVTDLKRVQIFMTEIVNSQPAIDALTDVIWKRFQDMKATSKPEPSPAPLFDEVPEPSINTDPSHVQ